MKGKEVKASSNVAAERGVLSGIFLDETRLAEIREILKPEDFFLHQHILVYDSMLRLADRKVGINYISIMDDLEKREKLEAAGGVGFISSFADEQPKLSRKHLLHYAGMVKRARIDRVLRARLAGVVDGGLEIEEITSVVSEALGNAFKELSESETEERPFLVAAASFISSLDERPVRVYSGIGKLDDMTGGYLPGELIVFTAETGVGKSLLAAQTRQKACNDGLVALYCSGEMLAEQVLARELAALAEVKPGKMRHPEAITPEEAVRLLAAAQQQCNRCKFLDTNLTTQKIARVARRMKTQDRLDLVIIDYDELVETEGKDEWEQQRNVAKFSKALAIEHRCSVILVSQLRKAIDAKDRKQPSIARIYGSGAKSKHPSIIIYVDRPFVRDLEGRETAATIAILKNRNGRVGTVKCSFNLDTLRFEEDIEQDSTPEPRRGKKEH